jgi:hypothetical protein
MEKVLIISYYFPPCNLTAAQRIGSWEKYLPENGFYPLVITRNWTGEELNEVQRLKKSGTNIRHIQKDNSEIFYMPYSATFRDRCFEKGKANRFYRILSKVLTAVYLIGQNFSIRFIPFNNLYFQARKILKKNPDIKHLIISGNPFEQFYFGYLLKKDFPHLKFIADYRDEWTTSELINFSMFKNFIWKLQKISEKRWIKKADLICANTEYAALKLGRFHNQKVEVLLNGYEIPEHIKNHVKIDSKKMTILHNGTLYPTQNLDILADALKSVHIPEGFILELKFPGIKIYPNVAKIIEQKLTFSNVILTLSDRIPQKEILKQQLDSDIMLMVAHQNKKGIVGSKLYEYIGLEKPILLCPTDGDEIEKTIIKTGLGIIIKNTQDLIINLENLISTKMETGQILMNANKKEIERYSRQAQVKKLSEYLNYE